MKLGGSKYVNHPHFLPNFRTPMKKGYKNRQEIRNGLNIEKTYGYWACGTE